MKGITSWAEGFRVNDRTWLILGKGPSYREIRDIDCSRFHLCSLNHVVREQKVTFAHIIDLDVVRDCADEIDRNAEFLVVPWHPHVNFRASKKALDSFFEDIPILEKLDAEGRLLCYNLSTGARYGTCHDSPVIEAKFFSAEAALNVLVACGVKTVRSLGVDGGSSYAQAFRDLETKTLLKNGHQNFDRQFEGIARTIRSTGIFYAPLYLPAPVRVFVGADSAQRLAAKVLEFSIKRHASLSIKLELIDEEGLPIPRAPKQRSRTGFSFARFRIPGLCGYRGRAIYMDADMLVLDDIAGLWSSSLEEADILYADQPTENGRVPQYSVLLMNCETLQWDAKKIVRGLDEDAYDYQQLMSEFAFEGSGHRRPSLPYAWNTLENYVEGETKLIHYTDMPKQPWISNDNPFRKIWHATLRDALDEGYIAEDFFYDEVAKGNVSPELPRWIGLPDPPNFAKMIESWEPPYRRLGNARPVAPTAANGPEVSADTATIPEQPMDRRLIAGLRRLWGAVIPR